MCLPFLSDSCGEPQCADESANDTVVSSLLHPKLHFSLTYHSQAEELHITVIEGEPITAAYSGEIVIFLQTEQCFKDWVTRGYCLESLMLRGLLIETLSKHTHHHTCTNTGQRSNP